MSPGRSKCVAFLPQRQKRHSPGYLLVLQLDAHHSEGVAGSVVVDVDAAEALLARLDGDPLLAGVVVDHDRGPRLADTLLTGKDKGTERGTKGLGLFKCFSVSLLICMRLNLILEDSEFSRSILAQCRCRGYKL